METSRIFPANYSADSWQWCKRDNSIRVMDTGFSTPSALRANLQIVTLRQHPKDIWHVLGAGLGQGERYNSVWEENKINRSCFLHDLSRGVKGMFLPLCVCHLWDQLTWAGSTAGKWMGVGIGTSLKPKHRGVLKAYPFPLAPECIWVPFSAGLAPIDMGLASPQKEKHLCFKLICVTLEIPKVKVL